MVPREEGIMVEIMFFDDEIKEMPKAYSKPEVKKEELDMAKTLIKSMSSPFDAAAYKDEYQERLKKLIEDKIAGKEVVSAEPEKAPDNVINLMDALKASIEQKENKVRKRA